MTKLIQYATATSRTVAAMIHATPIRRDADGRYCLNDLHKAAGGEPRHKPWQWLKNAQTQEVLDEVKAGNPAIEPIDLSRGRYGGTYVHKMLALDYSAWISPEFKLAVYTAFEEHTQTRETDMGTFTAPAGTPLSSMLLMAAEAVLEKERLEAELAAAVALGPAVNQAFQCSHNRQEDTLCLGIAPATGLFAPRVVTREFWSYQ